MPCCVCGTREPVACAACLGVSALTNDADWYVKRMSALHEERNALAARVRQLTAENERLTKELDDVGPTMADPLQDRIGAPYVHCQSCDGWLFDGKLKCLRCGRSA